MPYKFRYAGQSEGEHVTAGFSGEDLERMSLAGPTFVRFGDWPFGRARDSSGIGPWAVRAKARMVHV